MRKKNYVVDIDEVGRAAPHVRVSPRSYVVGVDEVGRGSLAGPVVVAALRMPRGFRFPRGMGELRDSKRFSAKQRERWFFYFKNHREIKYEIARVYPRTIERVNIASAANLAAARATARLVKSFEFKSYKIYLDGGLYLGSKTKQPRHAKTVIGGDETIASIKAASIVAKVLRDRQLRHLAKKYPQYGFEIHKGYGTKSHMRAIEKHGPCVIHRKSFLKKIK